MNDFIRILHLEDNKMDAELVRESLQGHGFNVDVQLVTTFPEYSQALAGGEFDLILSDFNLPSFDGLTALQFARKEKSDVPFIFVSGTIGEERAIESLKNGATDYVLKQNLTRLPSVISRSLKECEERAKRKVAEKRLVESESTYRTIVEVSGAALVLIDADTTIRQVNSVFTTLSGYDKEEVEGKRSWTEFVDPEDLPSMLRYHELRRTDPAAAPSMYEFRFVNKQGERRTVLLTIAMIPGSSTSVASMVDITERRKLDETIREQAALLDVGSEAITVLTMDDRIRYVNRGAERLYGLTREEATGAHVSACFPDLVWSQFEEAKRIVLQELEWRGNWIRRTRDGAEIIIDSHWTLVQDKQGSPRFIYVVDEDVTELKKLEQQFLRVQRLESIGTLAGGIAHDLNNILGPIMMAGSILKRDTADPKNQKLLETIEVSAKRGAAMIRQILTFARGVDGESVLLQPRHIIKEIVGIAKDTFPKSISIVEDLSKDLKTIEGDATQLHQTLLNLFVNARDAMPEGGELSILARNVVLDEKTARKHPMAQPGEYVMLTVRDTGTGIPSEALDKIFDPFFTTKEPGKGTGLGLSTVMGIVKSHGGFIDVRTELDKGTRFDLYFPVSEASSHANPARSQVPVAHGQNELILIIDDEVAIREVMKATLEGSGYRVLTTADGSDAIALFHAHRSDLSLIITDIMMPGMDGMELMNVLHNANPDQRFIVMSGLAESEKIESLVRPNHVTFLQKPFTSTALLESVAGMLKAVR